MPLEPELEFEARSFDHNWSESEYRTVQVEAKLGPNSVLTISEEYDPAIEDVVTVINRCAEDLKLLIARRGRS